MSADPESVAKEVSGRNNPWIGEFVAEDGDPIYFLFIEQQVLFSVNSFSRGLFCWFSSYYVFNLEYEKNSKELTLFFQEFVFGLPENSLQFKKSSTYLTVTTDIQKIVIH